MKEQLASLINREHALWTENNICPVVIMGREQTEHGDEKCGENGQEEEQLVRIWWRNSLEGIRCCSLGFHSNLRVTSRPAQGNWMTGSEVRKNKQKSGSVGELEEAWPSASPTDGNTGICSSSAEKVNLKVWLGMNFREKKVYLQVGRASLAELI